MKISFLFGAGFSRPAGYPLASELSEKVLRLQAAGIATHTDGQAWLRNEFLAHLQSTPTELFQDPFDAFSWPERKGAEALEAVLKVYGNNNPIPDYERFYDELLRYRRMEPELIDNPQFQVEYERAGLHNDPNRTGESSHLTQALSMAFKIFPQLLEQLIQPDPKASSVGSANAYQRFFDLLRTHSRRPRHFSIEPHVYPHEFYLHTLNHDLHVENWLEDEDLQEAINYCDGFSEAGSPHYGRVEFDNTFPVQFRQRPHHAYVRMPRFTGEFFGPVQLFKLHGSLNYWSFGVEGHDKGLYEPCVVKKQPWIFHLNLYREILVDGKATYRNDFTNYHSLFLSGTTAKIEQYQDPILFSRLLSRFSLNLTNSDALIVIGYGFRDDGINELLLPFLTNPAKKVIIIDKYAPSHSAIHPDMLRLGGLEAFDFAEVEALLAESIATTE